MVRVSLHYQALLFGCSKDYREKQMVLHYNTRDSAFEKGLTLWQFQILF